MTLTAAACRNCSSRSCPSAANASTSFFRKTAWKKIRLCQNRWFEKAKCHGGVPGRGGCLQFCRHAHFFGAEIKSFSVDTWKDAMEDIKCGKADYAVLPIENSSAGIVSENYDLLVEYDNYIVGEQIIRIDHSLMGLPGAKISDIRTVYSHPQALMQCSDFFDEHKDINQVAVRNTAFSAKKVKDDGDITQAGIASHISADIYGLQVLEEPHTEQ